MKIFLDTNIILEIMFEREFADACSSITLLSILDEVTEFVSASSITDIFYVSKKQFGRNDAIAKMKDILILTNIAKVDNGIINNAMNDDWEDFEDSVQYYTALAELCDCIITNNKQDFSKSSIPVYTPNEFLELVGSATTQTLSTNI
jgi:predicted nucleic acid-binding protein